MMSAATCTHRWVKCELLLLLRVVLVKKRSADACALLCVLCDVDLRQQVVRAFDLLGSGQ